MPSLMPSSSQQPPPMLLSSSSQQPPTMLLSSSSLQSPTSPSPLSYSLSIPLSEGEPLSSLQPPASLMQGSSLQSPSLRSASLQPLLWTMLPSWLMSPSDSLSTNFSAMEEINMFTPFSPQPSFSLQPPPSPMQRSSLQSPLLRQSSPLLVPLASLQPPPLMMPSSSQSRLPSYSFSTSLPAPLKDTNKKGNSMPLKRKERIIWTEELHQKFVWVVEQLGGPDDAVPKQILQIMNNPKLNSKHISSHLQKYRRHLEGIKGASKTATQEIESPSVVHEQCPVMDDINMHMTPSEMSYSAVTVEQRADSHQQLHPNPSIMSDEPLELPWEDSLLNYDDMFSNF